MVEKEKDIEDHQSMICGIIIIIHAEWTDCGDCSTCSSPVFISTNMPQIFVSSPTPKDPKPTRPVWNAPAPTPTLATNTPSTPEIGLDEQSAKLNESAMNGSETQSSSTHCNKDSSSSSSNPSVSPVFEPKSEKRKIFEDFEFPCLKIMPSLSKISNKETLNSCKLFSDITEGDKITTPVTKCSPLTVTHIATHLSFNNTSSNISNEEEINQPKSEQQQQPITKDLHLILDRLTSVPNSNVTQRLLTPSTPQLKFYHHQEEEEEEVSLFDFMIGKVDSLLQQARSALLGSGLDDLYDYDDEDDKQSFPIFETSKHDEDLMHLHQEKTHMKKLEHNNINSANQIASKAASNICTEVDRDFTQKVKSVHFVSESTNFLVRDAPQAESPGTVSSRSCSASDLSPYLNRFSSSQNRLDIEVLDANVNKLRENIRSGDRLSYEKAERAVVNCGTLTDKESEEENKIHKDENDKDQSIFLLIINIISLVKKSKTLMLIFILTPVLFLMYFVHTLSFNKNILLENLILISEVNNLKLSNKLLLHENLYLKPSMVNVGPHSKLICATLKNDFGLPDFSFYDHNFHKGIYKKMMDIERLLFF